MATTHIVWVLLFTVGSFYPNAAGVSVHSIDNIASRAECERLQRVLEGSESMPAISSGRWSRCIAVRKVKP